MSQQMVNGSHYDGPVTYTNRMSRKYAVVGIPGEGKWHKEKRHEDTQKRRKHREPKKSK